MRVIKSLQQSTRKTKLILFYLIAIFISYFLLEIGLLVNASFVSSFSVSALTPGSVVVDLVRGYRWGNGPVRSLHIYKNQIIYDQIIRPNNLGYLSSRDFYSKKPTSETKRIIVFGDSFTGSVNFSGTWPDRLHDLLQGHFSRGATQVEVYNFALPGIGLNNWSNIFFKEIVPNFEFDAVIFAVSSDNLNRDFYLNLETEEGKLLNMRFQVPPRSLQEFQSDFLPRMRPYGVVSDTEAMDKLLAGLTSSKPRAFIWPGIKVRAFNWFYFRLQKLKQKMELYFSIMDSRQISISELNERYNENNFKANLRRLFIAFFSPEKKGFFVVSEKDDRFRINKLDRLWEMLDYTRKKNIEVMFASIPDIARLLPQVRSKVKRKNSVQRELETIAQYSGYPFVDGYKMFYDIPEEQLLNKYWFPFDNHWQKQGGDLFADKLGKHIINTNWIKEIN